MAANVNDAVRSPDASERVSSLDVAAWFIELAVEEQRPLTRLPLQKLVTLVQSMYGFQTSDKMYDEKVFAFKYGPVTKDVGKKYGDTAASRIDKPRTPLKVLPDDKMDAVAELWGLCSDVTGKLVGVTHKVGPWKDHYVKDGKYAEIPWAEFVHAWPAYRKMILALKENLHPEVDRTPGNFILPESEFGKYDQQILKAQQHVCAAPLSR